MNNQELKIAEVNKLNELKKELDFIQLEERLEMVQLFTTAEDLRCSYNRSCSEK